jgi:PAS domain S-box-containing protein
MTGGFTDESKSLTGGLSDSEVARRKAWLELNPTDEQVIKEEIASVIEANVDDLMEMMYQHFLSFNETRSYFPDETTLKRARSAQKQYFLGLTKGNYNADYVRERLAIGSTHHRIALDPKWYIGAYNRALLFILPKLIERLKGNPERLSQTLMAFLKVIFFDMGLAIESYISADEAAIRKHRDVIRELETEQRVTKSIMENAPIGIVSISDDFRCLECNDEFLEIVGCASRKEVIGKQLFELAPHLEKAVFVELAQTGKPHRRGADRLCLSKTKGAEDNYWDWATWPIKDESGKISALVAMFYNATDRVLLQQQREDFVATLTHDLKTPVLATNRAVQFLIEGDFGPISAAQKEVLETLLQSNTSLYDLVQTLLDVYRFDSGVKELHIKSCNLASMITQLVTEIMPLAQEKGIDLKATLPTEAKEINCDENDMRRVLQNLIDNSLKYTPSGGSVTVSMSQADDKTTVSVSDTGKGIPDENKPKLFQRFWQAGSTGRYYASTGLGLYLSRRIVEAHGGTIWCESTLGKGSKFYFQI